MPKLIRLYIIQAAAGFCLSAVFVSGLLYLNIANLWHLVTHTDGGLLAVFLLWMFNGLVFAGVQFGISVMRMQDADGDQDNHPGNGPGLGTLIPVHAQASAKPRQRNDRRAMQALL